MWQALNKMEERMDVTLIKGGVSGVPTSEAGNKISEIDS